MRIIGGRMTPDWQRERRQGVIEAMEARRLDVRGLARLTGLDPRTVQRFLSGETFGLGTLDRLEGMLRIAPTGTRSKDSGGASRSNVVQGPVNGWEQAARHLGMSRWTLRRRRKQHGDKTSTSWWGDVGELKQWYATMIARESR